MKHSSREIFIIDDYQHVLVNELMSRSSEKSYDKFTDIGKHTWLILNTAGKLAENRRVYILAHTQTDDFGNIRMKTVRKMVDQMIIPESFFTIVLRATANNGNYLFSTQTNRYGLLQKSYGYV